ncbi:condensation domain-containing protein [Bacillus licheniformis]|nr:condensation domain-containing protein [Bacillus licheniformis]
MLKGEFGTRKVLSRYKCFKFERLWKIKSASGIDSGLLTEAIRKFVRTNDTMRFRLMFEGEDEPKQYIAEDEPFQIEYLMLQKAEEQTAFLNGDKLRRAGPCLCMTVRCLNLPLFALVKKKAGFCKVHHIISDGISMTILGNRITDIYLKLAKGETDLEPVQSSFTEHIQSELEYEIRSVSRRIKHIGTHNMKRFRSPYR